MKILLPFLPALFLFSCHSHKAVFSGTAWDQYTSVESAGFDANKLNQLTRFLADSANTTGLVAI